jgi:membrane-bound serine protease (ClpP class)
MTLDVQIAEWVVHFFTPADYNATMCNPLRTRCVLLLVLLFSLLPLTRASAAVDSDNKTPIAPVAIVSLHGEVNDYSGGLLVRQFNQAKKAGAKIVIIDIDTYGGIVVSGLDITHFIRSQTDVHTIAYVNRAISAGALIAVSCDEIVMAPSGVIGDCAPIVFKTDGSLDAMPVAERAKAQSPILNDFDASAEHAGYSKLLLESMVVAERVVYWVEEPKPPHKKQFVDQAEFDKLTAQGWVPVPGVPCPVDGPDTLLTIQTDEAVKLGLSNGTATSAENLAAQRGTLVANLTPGPGEKIIEFLNLDGFKGVVMTVLFMALYVVLGSPGHGLAETVTVLCLALLLGVPILTGYASWWEVLIIFGGLGLLAFEVFVFPGHGVSAAAGLLMMIVGLLLTFMGPQPGGGILPESAGSWLNLRHGAMAIGGSVTASIFLALWLQRYLPKLPFFSRLVLAPTVGNEPSVSSNPVLPENTWPGVGTSGVAVTDLRPGGSAEFLDLSVGDNRPVAVISETGYVPAGSKLIVREARGNRIVVRSA